MGWTNAVPVLHNNIMHILQPEVPQFTIPFTDNVPVCRPATTYQNDNRVFETIPVISLSKQYERKPLYFHISNVSHWRGLITMHCTDTVPPAAYTNLRDRSLTLRIQVTLFAQYCFNTGESFCDLGHFQQFRQRLIKPATIHTQHCSQNLVKPAPPPYYCGNIVLLFIVLYCIRIAVVSHLTCPVAGTTSHMTHHAAQLLSQAASLYSLLFSCSTLPLMCTWILLTYDHVMWFMVESPHCPCMT